MAAPDGRRYRSPVPAPLLVLGAVISVQTGQALGKQLIGTVGSPLGAVALRLLLAALLLLLLWRPRSLPAGRESRLLVLGLGTAIAGMNLVYLALERMPLGVAMTIQLTGPLAVSLVTSRRVRDAVWGLLAAAGIGCFLLPGSSPSGPLSVTGLVFAVLSAVSMGAYLLLSQRTGARMAGGGPLALAVLWAAVLTLPFGLAQSGDRLLQPSALATGLLVAVLSAALPYSLELSALRRLPARVVGILQSLEPVAAGLAGLLILHEQLSTLQWLAIGLITAASAGAVAAHTGRRVRP
ncbi:EamA family transporter [Promicromonospora panici]|uniref:EamA family transporter n=1 Tax=Promicromonospora panici TaxID=2219658 RepID=UPI00101CC8E7|nr:EamA family transporter [Promicromonospora panici]